MIILKLHLAIFIFNDADLAERWL